MSGFEIVEIIDHGDGYLIEIARQPWGPEYVATVITPTNTRSGPEFDTLADAREWAHGVVITD